MNYAPKVTQETKGGEARGCRNMRGRQDNVAVIVVVVRSSLTSSVRSMYASRRWPAAQRQGRGHHRCSSPYFLRRRLPLCRLIAHHPHHHHPCRLALFFTIVAVARPPPSSPLRLLSPPSSSLPSSSATRICCSSSPNVELVSFARLQHSCR